MHTLQQPMECTMTTISSLHTPPCMIRLRCPRKRQLNILSNLPHRRTNTLPLAVGSDTRACSPRTPVFLLQAVSRPATLPCYLHLIHVKWSLQPQPQKPRTQEVHLAMQHYLITGIVPNGSNRLTARAKPVLQLSAATNRDQLLIPAGFALSMRLSCLLR